jgi:hypothetical protein
MAGHGEKFGRKKEAAIVALLSQASVESAARAAGIGTRTLVRWMQNPEFKAAYDKARRDAFGQARARLQQASGAAVSTILKIMLDKEEPASSRLRAAEAVLTHAGKSQEEAPVGQAEDESQTPTLTIVLPRTK